jgi:hypothetical protein
MLVRLKRRRHRAQAFVLVHRGLLGLRARAIQTERKDSAAWDLGETEEAREGLMEYSP